MSADAEFGKRLRVLRRRQGLLQGEFAEKCGLSDNAVRSYEQGVRYPTLWSLKKMRQALGCTWDELLGGDE